MPENNHQSSAGWVRWLLLGLLLLAQIIVLLIAPAEKTIGVGIKPVYLHVSLTWTGMLLLAGVVLLGLWILISGNSKTVVWLQRILTSGFIFYGVGFIVSIYASVINWGGVPFGEPAVRQAMGYMLVGFILWAATWWLRNSRLQGGISLLAAGMLLLATDSSQSILHPESPINTSPLSIKSTFYIMFGLAIVLGWWSLDLQCHFTKKRQHKQGLT